LKIFKNHRVQPISIDLVECTTSSGVEDYNETTAGTGAGLMDAQPSDNVAVAAISTAPQYRAFSGGWIEYFTEDGSPYYYNEAADESSWYLPEGVVDIVPSGTEEHFETDLQIHSSIWADPSYYKDGTESKSSSINMTANILADDDTSEVSFDDGGANESVASSLSSGEREVARIASENAAMNQMLLAKMVTEWNPGNIGRFDSIYTA